MAVLAPLRVVTPRLARPPRKLQGPRRIRLVVRAVPEPHEIVPHAVVLLRVVEEDRHREESLESAKPLVAPARGVAVLYRLVEHVVEDLAELRLVRLGPAWVVADELRRLDEEEYLAVVERGGSSLPRVLVEDGRIDEIAGPLRVAFVTREAPHERLVVREASVESDSVVESAQVLAAPRSLHAVPGPARAGKRVKAALPRLHPGVDHRLHAVEVALRVADARVDEHLAVGIPRRTRINRFRGPTNAARA